jgi:hypothetical protein
MSSARLSRNPDRKMATKKAAPAAPTVVQGLTLVHFSAQLHPFVTLNMTPTHPNTPSTPALNNP